MQGAYIGKSMGRGKTKAEAEEAHGLIAKVIVGTDTVTPSGSGAGQGVDDGWR
jgi:hypothetical protein